MRHLLHDLAARIRPDSRITILTGAGVSAASGVPTFRGPGGIWRTYKPESLATPAAFERDPQLVWEWYNWRREVLSQKQPNEAHRVIAAWSRRYPNFSLITQNVDGLHERAGTPNVVRFHGSIWEVRCWNRCPHSPVQWSDTTVPFPQIPPRCPHCDGLLRPGVVWFGEPINPAVLQRTQKSLNCDIFLTVGTSAVVYPAASLAHAAKACGAYTVEINIETTPSSNSLDLALAGPAEEMLPSIEALLA